MAYSLGKGSRAELAGVHPGMVRMAEIAIALSSQDFTVHDGLRTEAEQKQLVIRGASQTMNSMHRLQRCCSNGHALDLVPWINGKPRWEWRPIYVIAAAMRQALDVVNAERVKLKLKKMDIVWGACWDRPMSSFAATPAAMKAAADGYVARRKAMKKSAFLDGPHFQLLECPR